MDEGRFRCGTTQIILEHAEAVRPSVRPSGGMRARGYRYLTVQVCDCDAEYAAALSRGAHHGRAPITPGVADRTAFVRDPDGNWLEIAKRASPTRPAR